MYSPLKERDYYEDLYDEITVESGRDSQKRFLDFYNDFLEKCPDEDPNRYGVILHMNIIYMAMVGNELLDRYNRKEEEIQEWINRDTVRESLLKSARLTTEPKCEHCHKAGLRIISKDLMNRKINDSFSKEEEVLFILRCPHCNKNTAISEDGTEWEHRKVECPDCDSVLEEKSSRKNKIVTTVYTCQKCGHTHKEKTDYGHKEEVIDPEYEKDRPYYTLADDKIREELRDARYRFEEMARLGKEMKERSDNKHIYDEIKAMKKPKIAELSELLSPTLNEEGFIEFSLDKPEVGKQVVVGFSCLDNKPERNDYESEKVLKKIVKNSLENTNWRLMSDGISYRLGYLSGRLKAYESENSIKELVENRIRKKK
jgi:predicted RNA-binding Zn-ribbon protein involved in translation (DUF1610 family)